MIASCAWPPRQRTWPQDDRPAVGSGARDPGVDDVGGPTVGGIGRCRWRPDPGWSVRTWAEILNPMGRTVDTDHDVTPIERSSGPRADGHPQPPHAPPGRPARGTPRRHRLRHGGRRPAVPRRRAAQRQRGRGPGRVRAGRRPAGRAPRARRGLADHRRHARRGVRRQREAAGRGRRAGRAAPGDEPAGARPLRGRLVAGRQRHRRSGRGRRLLACHRLGPGGEPRRARPARRHRRRPCVSGQPPRLRAGGRSPGGRPGPGAGRAGHAGAVVVRRGVGAGRCAGDPVVPGRRGGRRGPDRPHRPGGRRPGCGVPRAGPGLLRLGPGCRDRPLRPRRLAAGGRAAGVGPDVAA